MGLQRVETLAHVRRPAWGMLRLVWVMRFWPSTYTSVGWNWSTSCSLIDANAAMMIRSPHLDVARGAAVEQVVALPSSARIA